MVKHRYSAPSQPKSKSNSGGYGNYKERDMMHASPMKMQEECKPSESEPVRMQKRMAGCS